MTKAEIKRAAYRLKQWAEALRKSHTTSNDEYQQAAIAEADEMDVLSRKLYAVARAQGKTADKGKTADIFS